MKNPLTNFSKVFRTAMDGIPMTEAVTLEFCYDHINDDYPAFNPNELLHLQHEELLPLGIQGNE